jgi:hypothetical protein
LADFHIVFIFGNKPAFMIKISDLQEGDVVRVLHDGEERDGIITDVDREENQAEINNGIQEFWYNPDQIVPVPVTEYRLINVLGFEKEEIPTGVKFKKGAFRVIVNDPGNYTNIDLWYREDHRHFNHALYLHELQNLHLQMTKVQLERLAAH